MEEEFELTYLPRRLPRGLFNSDSKEILDVYIPVTAAHPILRIRKCGNTLEITKKQPVAGTDSSHQIEHTISLSPEEFSTLMQVEGKKVRKIRYYYTEGDAVYECDVFQDDLRGLVLVDVEFTSHKEKSKFEPPEWILADVTQEKFIAGGMLCGKKYADIESELTQYEYQPIVSE